jgi:triacylglycerol lipase
VAVQDSAEELAARIREIVQETGCEKVNIIAHSKGGLDCRWALHYLGVAPMVASLTTVNTPHRGCLFAENLIETLPQKVQNGIEKTYNSAYRVLGDTAPDFMAAVKDLTASVCTKRDGELPLPEGVYCQSVGSEIKTAWNGRFPMNLSFLYVKNYDGPNDGLVATTSFAFGEKYTFLSTDGKRGISHGDVIDLNRENIEGFDVREFYVELVRDLAARGF